MKLIKIFLTMFCILSFFTHSQSLAESNSTQNEIKILFIGSSYFHYNNLPNIIKGFAENAGKKVFIDNMITSGYLSDHAQRSTTEAKINEQDWDYVVLQGVGSVTAYPEHFTRHPVYPALVTLKEKITKNSESTQMLFCLPWAFEDGMIWMDGWTDLYEDMQIKIYDNTLRYSEEIGFPIAPVGWAWYKVLEDKNYPLHYLHIDDWNHPSLKGSYLMACVIYSSIFKESTLNIGYNSGLPEKEAEYFQKIASQVVLDSLELWNLLSINSVKNEYSSPQEIQLYQNYPNPFNPSTNIEFDLALKTNPNVELVIYDILGRKIKTLLNENLQSGNYKVEFDGNQLSSGIYYYKLKADHFFEIKKMLHLK